MGLSVHPSVRILVLVSHLSDLDKFVSVLPSHPKIPIFTLSLNDASPGSKYCWFHGSRAQRFDSCLRLPLLLTESSFTELSLKTLDELQPVGALHHLFLLYGFRVVYMAK